MKKRLFTLMLALILCLGVFPMEALAGSIGTWHGGQTGHDHQPATDSCIKVDDTYHQRYVYCTCGAEATMGVKEKHDLKYICPLTDDPQGRDIYECSQCKAMIFLPGSGACKHKHKTKMWDDTNHWDECDSCHQHFNEKPHKQGKLQKEDSQHWYACTGCKAHLKEESHKLQYWKHDSSNHWKSCFCGYQDKGNKQPHTSQWNYDDSKHWQECECGWTSSKTKHKMVKQSESGGVVTYACECGYSTSNQLKDLSGAKFTGTKGDGEKYSSSEIKNVGLEGLKEGKDYTKSITTEDNGDGTQSWVVKFKPVEGVSTGERTFKGKKKTQEAEQEKKYKLTIEYKAADPKYQDLMPPAKTVFLPKGASYWYNAPVVKDMKPDIDKLEGRMPDRDTTITFTYDRMYTLTIHYVYPPTTGQDDAFGEGIRDVTLQLKDGEAYRVETKEITSDKDSPYNQVKEAGEFGGNFFGMSLWLGTAPAWVPDKEVVEGKIEGADKEETVTFTCPHPDKWLQYEPNDNYEKGKAGTHTKTCTACYSLLAEEEPCAYGEPKYITAADLAPADREKTPNGRYLYTCSKCEDSYILSADDEPCPESPEGLPHIWTLWYKADAEHCHRTCARCGLDVTEPHVWSAWSSMGGLHHYRKCAHCREVEEADHGNWKNITVKKKATCIENAVVDATCGVCNARVTNVSASLLGKEYLATGHDFENGPWHIDGPKTVSAEGAGGHYKSCAVCGVTDREHMTGHTWGGKTVISAGVCDDPSKKHVEEATCTACGAKLHSETEVHHDQVRYPEGDIAATCENYGKEAYKCSHCNTVFGDAIAPLGHDMQVVEKKDADCEHEGFIKRKCSRCDKEETEVLEKKSKSGKHQWVPNVSIPDCLLPGEAKGETCSVCGATQAGKTGFETFPALGHKVKKETRTVGRTREYVSDNGVTTCTCYEVYYICERCGHALGHEYYTVGTNPKISRYQIEPGKNVRIDDVSGGIHIDGNMANDGGVYFDGEVKKGLNDQLDWAGKKYVWKKTPANSFIIEFTPEFLAELADGEYPVEIFNGDEYWPMILVIRRHKIVQIKKMPEEEFTGLEFTPEQLEAWKRDVTRDGTVLHEYYQGCPAREE